MSAKNEVYEALDSVKEYLALNKWNEAMMLMAQISIKVVENLVDEALIVSKGYEEDLKTLEAGGIINEATSHNLTTLIVSGVQAHSGVDIPSDYVRKACEVLEDELKVVYNDDIKLGVTDDRKEKAFANAEKKQDGFEYNEDDVVKQGYEDDQEMNIEEDDDEPAFINKDGEVDFRVKERLRKESLNPNLKIDKKKIFKLLAIILPIILIIVVAFLIKSCVSSKPERKSKRTEVHTIQTTEMEFTEEVTETEPPTTTEAGMWTVTGDMVWVRDQANTTSSKRLAGLNKGDQVRVIRNYDDNWAIINYDGKEAFISRGYIRRSDEQETIAPEQ